MTEYITILGEKIVIGSIVESEVRIRTQHQGWGIVEELHPAR